MTLKPSPGRRGDPVWLPEVLRAFGVTVKEMDGWKNWGHGDFTRIDGVIAHHTAGANTSAEYIARNPGVGNGLSSQIHLARDGVVTLCGVGIAWHAGEAVQPPLLTGYRTVPGNTRPQTVANAATIGIEAVNAGDGSQPWPEAQMDAYYRTTAAILWYLGLDSSRVWGHKEIAPRRKIDPNFDMGAFRTRVQAYIDSPPFAPTTPNTPTGGSMFGPEQVGALHEAKVAAQEAREVLGGEYASLINPQHSFTLAEYATLIDAATWEQRKLSEAIAKKLGLDPDTIIEEAIKADRGEL